MGRGTGPPGLMLQAGGQAPAATPCSNMLFYTVMQQASFSLAIVRAFLWKRLPENEAQRKYRKSRRQDRVEFPFPQTVHGEWCPKGYRWDSPHGTHCIYLNAQLPKMCVASLLHEPMHTSVEHTSTWRERHCHELTDTLYAPMYLYMGLLFGHTCVVHVCSKHTR